MLYLHSKQSRIPYHREDYRPHSLALWRPVRMRRAPLCSPAELSTLTPPNRQPERVHGHPRLIAESGGRQC